MVPSSFMISQMTPLGCSPARRAKSTLASVCPVRVSTPPGRARRGNTWPGFTKCWGLASGAMRAWMVRERSWALMPVEQGPLQGRADQSASVGGHEGDGLRCNMLGRQGEVALVLAVLVIHH